MTTQTEVTDKIVVCIEGQDQFWNYDDFGLTYTALQKRG